MQVTCFRSDFMSWHHPWQPPSQRDTRDIMTEDTESLMLEMLDEASLTRHPDEVSTYRQSRVTWSAHCGGHQGDPVQFSGYLNEKRTQHSRNQLQVIVKMFKYSRCLTSSVSLEREAMVLCTRQCIKRANRWVHIFIQMCIPLRYWCVIDIQVLAIKQVPVDTDLQDIIKEISIMQQCVSPYVVRWAEQSETSCSSLSDCFLQGIMGVTSRTMTSG